MTRWPRPGSAIGAQGGNGFLEVAATHAALLLAQGTGRLLRSVHDKGVVAVLDPRLATARYGAFLRASLPPYWGTTDPGRPGGAVETPRSVPRGSEPADRTQRGARKPKRRIA